MDTMSDKNTENHNQTEPSGGFWHSGWAYLIFFIGLVGVMVAISYVLKGLV
jgi:hypothetical protein